MDELRILSRPQWRRTVPVHWTGPTQICIGDDTLVDNVTPVHVAWISGLDGTRTARQVENELVISEVDAARILRALFSAGALVDAGQIPAGLRWIAEHERPAVQARHEAALDCYRDPRQALLALERRDRVRVLVEGPEWLADPLTAALRSAGLRCASIEGEGPVDLVVIADSPHPDVPLDFDSPARLGPHLHVGIRGGLATVGPIVIPGVTSCLRCAHLHRRDIDPAWPLLSVQWEQSVLPEADPLLVRLVSAHAASLLRTHIDQPDQPDIWANQAWHLQLPLGLITRLERPPHPMCGCRWQVVHEQEAALWESA